MGHVLKILSFLIYTRCLIIHVILPLVKKNLHVQGILLCHLNNMRKFFLCYFEIQSMTPHGVLVLEV